MRAVYSLSSYLFSGFQERLATNLIIGQPNSLPNNRPVKSQFTGFDVAIAQIRLWKTARTPVDIRATMNRYMPTGASREHLLEKDLIGYWRLDDCDKAQPKVYNQMGDWGHGIVEGAQPFPSPREAEMGCSA